ncbi:hypothetical protein FKG94_14700 [Exilibacterium tricleocarpae]|uniref:Uncharacterized protein n=1 Tax=Exilibacterium tricleocarpae TaxID=2591008 RepID=A0A545TK64_9GAMM|nr:hypothetical protein [Exilibacterium tricleocarpae]TQV77619.1 hypothetical protein FKG94_14700 [Exilibacterium tricleocarpae]
MKKLYLLLFLIVPMIGNSVELKGRDKVTDTVAGHIEEILTSAGLTSASIARGSDTPKGQATVMYDYYLKPDAPNCKVGKQIGSHICACQSYSDRLACAKATYGSIGDAAIDSITDPAKRNESIVEMTSAIEIEIAEAGVNRNQLAHVPIAGRYAVDIKPSSISDKEKFKQAVMTHPNVIKERFFYPGKIGGPAETAFHIEFVVD